MKFNKIRKLNRNKPRDKIISKFNQLYPYEFVIEYINDEWIDFYIKGNFGLTYEDIRKELEILIRNEDYIINPQGDKIYCKNKHKKFIITIKKVEV